MAKSASFHILTENDDRMEKLIITPKTRIYDLLEAYPQLEDVLIDAAPPFEKLKNPVLRKTVTKITTLSQAAVIGGLKVEALVNRLRSMVGQSDVESFDSGSSHYVTLKPIWFQEHQIAEVIDIRTMLNAGDQPVHEVLAAMKRLDTNQILMVVAPFIPVPLIDKSLSINYQHWVEVKGDEEVNVYFIVV